MLQDFQSNSRTHSTPACVAESDSAVKETQAYRTPKGSRDGCFDDSGTLSDAQKQIFFRFLAPGEDH
jgi:hypothetical protein